MNSSAMPLISVIVPALNASAHIREALNSAIQQTYRRIEVIVVDDGSCDDTVRIVEEIAANDARVRMIQQSNAGVAAARNRAIAASGGEFVAPLDADDIWDTTKLERQLQRMKEGGRQAGLAYSWWVWIDEERNVLDWSPRWQMEGDVLEMLTEINFMGNASVPLFRRECVEEVGGYSTRLLEQGAQGCEDWELALRVAERYSVLLVPAFLTGYRRLSNCMSSACDTMWESHSIVLEGLQRHHPGIPQKTLLVSRAQFALYLAGISCRSGSFFKALKWGFRVKNSGLLLAVLPYLPSVIARHLIGKNRETGKYRLDSFDLSHTNVSDAMIPYDRIYARRWLKSMKHKRWEGRTGNVEGSGKGRAEVA